MRWSLAKTFFSNLRFKLAAGFLAFVFWYVVQSEEILEINQKIAIHFILPSHYLIRGETVRFKDVTISGPRVLLSEFQSQPLEAKIFIPSGSKGALRFRVGKAYLQNWNSRLKLVVHDPYETVYIDRKETKTVPIKENLKGLPREGYIIEKSILQPTEIKISGAKSELEKIEYVSTEVVDITDAHKSRIFVATLIQPLETIELLTSQTELQIQIGEKKVNRSFARIPVEIEGIPRQTLPQRFVTVTVQGTRSVTEFLQKKSFRAFVQASGLGVGRHQLKIQIKIPDDTALIEIEPDVIELDIAALATSRRAAEAQADLGN